MSKEKSPLTEIVMAAAQLKAAAPQFFSQLCDALRAYEVQSIAESLAGEKRKDIFRAQGKVKTVQQLRKHMNECTELRDVYTGRTNGRPNAS